MASIFARELPLESLFQVFMLDEWEVCSCAIIPSPHSTNCWFEVMWISAIAVHSVTKGRVWVQENLTPTWHRSNAPLNEPCFWTQAWRLVTQTKGLFSWERDAKIWQEWRHQRISIFHTSTDLDLCVNSLRPKFCSQSKDRSIFGVSLLLDPKVTPTLSDHEEPILTKVQKSDARTLSRPHPTSSFLPVITHLQWFLKVDAQKCHLQQCHTGLFCQAVQLWWFPGMAYAKLQPELPY